MAYWPEARRWAQEHSKTFGPWKAIPGILGALFQFYFGGASVSGTALAVATGITIYLLCYGVDFLWKLFVLAPVAIHEQQLERIKELTGPEFTPLQIERIKAVSGKLDQANDDDLAVLRYVLMHGEVVPVNIASLGDNSIERILSAVGRGIAHTGLLKATDVYSNNMPKSVIINPVFKEALESCILNRPIMPAEPSGVRTSRQPG